MSQATAGASLAAAVQSVPATSTVVYTESVNTPEAPPVDSIPAAPLSVSFSYPFLSQVSCCDVYYVCSLVCCVVLA